MYRKRSYANTEGATTIKHSPLTIEVPYHVESKCTCGGDWPCSNKGKTLWEVLGEEGLVDHYDCWKGVMEDDEDSGCYKWRYSKEVIDAAELMIRHTGKWRD